MTFREFVDEFRGVRRTILAFSILWTSVSVGAGCWAVVTGVINAPAATFLSAVMALAQIPVGAYFHYRGKEDNGK